MSDSENDSRAMAVGRKRNRTGEYPISSTTAASRADGGEGSGIRRSSSKETTSRRSSLESGEISSTGERRSRSPVWDNKDRRNSIPVSFPLPKRRRLTESTSGSVFDEEPVPIKAVSSSESSMPTKAFSFPKSSDNDEVTTEPHAMASNITMPGTRICELSHEEVVQQELYFDLDLDRYPDDLCYCLCCGGRGHMQSTCSKGTCEHCGAKESHASYACPTYRKCRLCRKRGHDASECTNPASALGSTPCDICQEAGHVEEECPRLWSTSLEPDPTYKIRKIPDKQMIRACYSCGSRHHWGNDCQYSDRRMPPSLLKTWSKTFADQFVNDHDYHVEPVEPVEDRSDALEWQLAMLDDGRD